MGRTSIPLLLILAALILPAAAATHLPSFEQTTRGVFEVVDPVIFGVTGTQGDEQEESENPSESSESSSEPADESPSDEEESSSDPPPSGSSNSGSVSYLLGGAQAAASNILWDTHATASTVVGGSQQTVTQTVETIRSQVTDLHKGLEDSLLASGQEVPETTTEQTPAKHQQAAPASVNTHEVPVSKIAFWTGAATLGILLTVALSLGSSASSTGAGSGVLYRLRRFLLLPFAGLFTRFARENILDHPKREELNRLVAAEPGVTLQSLCQSTGLSRTAATHHLRLLEQHHLLVSRRVGRTRHYFENGGRYPRSQKEAYAVLRNDRSREVAHFIRQNPGTMQKWVCEELGVQASIAHWHVARLCEASLVETVRRGRAVHYYPTAELAAMAD